HRRRCRSRRRSGCHPWKCPRVGNVAGAAHRIYGAILMPRVAPGPIKTGPCGGIVKRNPAPAQGRSFSSRRLRRRKDSARQRSYHSPMNAARRPWWPVVKLVVGLAILVFVGRRFALDLSRPELYTEPIGVGWLVASGLLYLLGLGVAATYWGWLLARLGT